MPTGAAKTVPTVNGADTQRIAAPESPRSSLFIGPSVFELARRLERVATLPAWSEPAKRDM
jgi:hypothetical protein